MWRNFAGTVLVAVADAVADGVVAGTGTRNRVCHSSSVGRWSLAGVWSGVLVTGTSSSSHHGATR